MPHPITDPDFLNAWFSGVEPDDLGTPVAEIQPDLDGELAALTDLGPSLDEVDVVPLEEVKPVSHNQEVKEAVRRILAKSPRFSATLAAAGGVTAAAVFGAGAASAQSKPDPGSVHGGPASISAHFSRQLHDLTPQTEQVVDHPQGGAGHTEQLLQDQQDQSARQQHPHSDEVRDGEQHAKYVTAKRGFSEDLYDETHGFPDGTTENLNRNLVPTDIPIGTRVRVPVDGTIQPDQKAQGETTTQLPPDSNYEIIAIQTAKQLRAKGMNVTDGEVLSAIMQLNAEKTAHDGNVYTLKPGPMYVPTKNSPLLTHIDSPAKHHEAPQRLTPEAQRKQDINDFHGGVIERAIELGASASFAGRNSSPSKGALTLYEDPMTGEADVAKFQEQVPPQNGEPAKVIMTTADGQRLEVPADKVLEYATIASTATSAQHTKPPAGHEHATPQPGGTYLPGPSSVVPTPDQHATAPAQTPAASQSSTPTPASSLPSPSSPSPSADHAPERSHYSSRSEPDPSLGSGIELPVVGQVTPSSGTADPTLAPLSPKQSQQPGQHPARHHEQHHAHHEATTAEDYENSLRNRYVALESRYIGSSEPGIAVNVDSANDGGWCAKFQIGALNELGVHMNLGNNFGPRAIETGAAGGSLQQAVEENYSYYTNAQTRYTPQPGDWVFFKWTEPGPLQGDGHVGMVKSVTRAPNGTLTLTTIEGDSANGVVNEVHYSNFRQDPDILGFGNVLTKTAEATHPTNHLASSRHGHAPTSAKHHHSPETNANNPDPKELAAFMAAELDQESAGDWHSMPSAAVCSAPGGGPGFCTGGLQMSDAMWNNYGGYAHAGEAPASVQYNFARHIFIGYWHQFGGDWSKVAMAWFAGPGFESENIYAQQPGGQPSIYQYGYDVVHGSSTNGNPGMLSYLGGHTPVTPVPGLERTEYDPAYSAPTHRHSHSADPSAQRSTSSSQGSSASSAPSSPSTQPKLPSPNGQSPNGTQTEPSLPVVSPQPSDSGAPTASSTPSSTTPNSAPTSSTPNSAPSTPNSGQGPQQQNGGVPSLPSVQQPGS